MLHVGEMAYILIGILCRWLLCVLYVIIFSHISSLFFQCFRPFPVTLSVVPCQYPDGHLPRVRWHLFDVLLITTVPTVLLCVEILPLIAHAFVAFHLRHSLRPLELVPLEGLDKVAEDERVGSLRAVFGQHPDEQ